MTFPTGTVTFLFTDIQGSTPLWEREPEQMAAALQIHHAVLQKAIETNGGVVFKTVGDAFQTAFPTAPQALRAAIDGQRALQAATWNELGPLTVRMGIHTGQAELDPGGDEYAVSHTKNRVARIMAVAHGGQILLSLATAELLRGHLPPQVTLKDLGEHHLKGMLQTERIFQAFAPGLPIEMNPLGTRPIEQPNLLEKALRLALAAHPEGSYDFLNGKIYSNPLTEEEQIHFLQLLSFIRSLQNDSPVYETIFQQLLFFYVLNGSRLDLLKSIDRRLRGLAEGESALVFLEGIPGIGKTSLVMAFQDRMRQLGAELVAVHCSGQSGLSYTLWQDAAHAAASLTGRPLETLPAPIGKGKEAQSSQQVKQTFADWLANCSAAQPLVILLDDLHWADEDSLDVLDYLTSQTVQPPILYIATYRSDEPLAHHQMENIFTKLRRNRKVNHLHLSPLPPEDVARFVAAFLGGDSPRLAQYLYDRAEGHPLFTAELLNDLIDQGLLSKDPGGVWLPPEQSVPVPAFLKQLINQRVSRLGSRVEQFLVVAAVAGETWSLSIVEPLVNLPEEELLEAVESALRAEVIASEDDKAEIYRFSHGLIREVIYMQLPARRRKRYHEQIAAQLEQQQPAQIQMIAHHFLEAECWEKAVGYCLAAGEAANRQFANYSAIGWYQQALKACDLAGKALPPAVGSTIFDRLGRSHRALGQRKEAEIVYSRMRDFAQGSGDLGAEGIALVNLANARASLYQLDLAEKTALEALKIGEQTGDTTLLAHVNGSLGGIAMVLGQLGQASHYYEVVLRHTEELKNSATLLDALRQKAYQAIWVGQYSEGVTYANRALKFARETGDPLVIGGASLNLAFAQVELGHYLPAHDSIRATLEAVAVSGAHHHQKPRLLNLMGYLFLELGDPREALLWDQKALHAILDNQVQSIEMRRYSLLNQATDYLHLGDMAKANDAITQFERIKEAAEYVHFRYFNRYQLLMCELYLAQGDTRQTIELAQEARSLAQSKGMRKNVARSHWLEAQALSGLMRFNEALVHLEKAVRIADEIEHGSLRWKIRMSLAETLRKTSKSPAEVIQEARAQVDQTIQSLVGSPLHPRFMASPWIERLEKLEKDSTSEKPTYPASLTEREVEVLRLVAGGATNQQVADALHISVRTVNTHMTNILNKTGCENRTAAATFAIQKGLLST